MHVIRGWKAEAHDFIPVPTLSSAGSLPNQPLDEGGVLDGRSCVGLAGYGMNR